MNKKQKRNYNIYMCLNHEFLYDIMHHPYVIINFYILFYKLRKKSLSLACPRKVWYLK